MVTVTVVTSRSDTTTDRSFDFMHAAKSWLLLAGYLPIQDDQYNYQNPFTGDVAYIKGIHK